jgi:NADPH-dependent glutamate synthase beta subunit-like oxidoreductase
VTTRHIAVVGSGPAGMYLVEALLKLLPGPLAIDVIDRLPTPYGLVRSGVAPDHASVRAVTRRFEQSFDRPGVRFLGGVEVGRDLPLDELRRLYDAVVLANGCALDKSLGIAGEQLPGVWGSACYTGWYNAHPDHAGLAINALPPRVVVIGSGNVAIDVARLLCKPEAALAATDMSPTAVQLLGRPGARQVVLAGRRGPMEARFSVKELEELGEVARVSVAWPDDVAVPDETCLQTLPPAQSTMLQALLAYNNNSSNSNSSGTTTADPPQDPPHSIEFQFLARPAEILGRERVEAVRFERMHLGATGVQGTGTYFDLPCGAVITCIGYRANPLAALAVDPVRGGLLNHEALITTGLYCTGWARRGPSGTIATNRSDATQVAQRIAHEVPAGGTEGPAGLDRLLQQRGVRPVSVADWRAIDQAECARAAGTAPRQKFHSLAAMFEVLTPNTAIQA